VRLFSGRLSRGHYFEAIIAYILLYAFTLYALPSYANWGVILLNVLFTPFVIKRLHDLGVSGWLSLLLYIPYVGIIFEGALVFQPGENKSNKYGQPPK